MRRSARCECGKVCYATARVAERRLRWIQAVSSAEKQPTRTYRGPCGWWHLTSQPEPEEASA